MYMGPIHTHVHNVYFKHLWCRFHTSACEETGVLEQRAKFSCTINVKRNLTDCKQLTNCLSWLLLIDSIDKFLCNLAFS